MTDDHGDGESFAAGDSPAAADPHGADAPEPGRVLSGDDFGEHSNAEGEEAGYGHGV